LNEKQFRRFISSRTNKHLVFASSDLTPARSLSSQTSRFAPSPAATNNLPTLGAILKAEPLKPPAQNMRKLGDLLRTGAARRRPRRSLQGRLAAPGGGSEQVLHAAVCTGNQPQWQEELAKVKWRQQWMANIGPGLLKQSFWDPENCGVHFVLCLMEQLQKKK
jgi:hypothetical protein